MNFEVDSHVVKQPATNTETNKHKRPGGMREAIESAAPSRGTKRAEPELENLQTPKPQPAPHTLPGQPQNTAQTTFGPQISDIFRILGPLFSVSKNL